ncbi:hypothetical protein FRC02_001592, partial [Tulasnella sp. 418]
LADSRIQKEIKLPQPLFSCFIVVCRTAMTCRVHFHSRSIRDRRVGGVEPAAL